MHYKANECEKYNEEINTGNAPELLVVHLKRFLPTDRGYFVKDCTVVARLYEGTLYQLIGMVNHSGSMNCGHYTANIKVNDRWKLCNDSRVADHNSMGQKSKSAYLLFYIVSESMVSLDHGGLARFSPNSITE